MKKLTKKDSQGNEIQIFVYEPKTEPKAVLHIIHGASEHFARYGLFAEYLNAHGFIVIGSDILGHGLSTKTTEYVHFADKDGHKIAFESVTLVTDYIIEKYPNLKHFVLGHSMGEFLARKVLIDRPEVYEKAVWSGSTSVPAFMSRFGIILSDLIACIKGPKYVSRFIQDLAVDSNPKKMRKLGLIKELNEEWLTHDR
ncbi:MAG: alpha/beta fold hydrolase, partial [Bacilli bacterium]|nr:alpha/beta fold hydrolase [Bacilli bacterium]